MRWKLLAWMVVAGVVAVGGVGYALVRGGASARTGLSRIEERTLYNFRESAVAADAQDISNPYKDDAEAWRGGAHHFHEECALCHGPAGRGDGRFGSKLSPAAPDLTAARTQRLSDGELYHIISQGIRFSGMPAMADDESPDEMWKLVSLVRKLPALDADAISRAASVEGEHEGLR